MDWTTLFSISFVPFVDYFDHDFVSKYICGKRSFSRDFRNKELTSQKDIHLLKFLKFFLELMSEVVEVFMMDDCFFY